MYVNARRNNMTFWSTSLIVSTLIYIVEGEPQEILSPLIQCSIQERLNNGLKKFPDTYNSNIFYICEEGILTMKFCPPGEVFDVNLSDCIISEQNTLETKKLMSDSLGIEKYMTSNDEEAFTCPSKRTKNYPDDKSCRKYYRCEDGIPLKQTCPIYFLFDSKSEMCTLFWMASCANAYPTPNCSQTEVNKPYANDCKHYWHCSNGEATLEKCGWLQLFDKNKLKCRLFLLASCDKQRHKLNVNSERHGEERSNYDVYDLMTNRVEENFKRLSYSAEPKCEKGDVYKKPYPNHCKKFYDCNNGVLKIYSCFVLFDFDPISLSCKWFWQVKCQHQVPTTTTAVTISSFSTANLTSTTFNLTTLSINSTTTTASTFSTVNQTSLNTTYSTATTKNSTLKSTTATFKPQEKLFELTSDELKENNRKLHFNYVENYECVTNDTYDDVYPEDCAKYYHCDNGELSIEKCPWFKKFDPIQLKCRWFFLVHCQAQPAQPTSTPLVPTPYYTTQTTCHKTTHHRHKTTHHPHKTTHHHKSTHHTQKTTHNHHKATE